MAQSEWIVLDHATAVTNRDSWRAPFGGTIISQGSLWSTPFGGGTIISQAGYEQDPLPLKKVNLFEQLSDVVDSQTCPQDPVQICPQDTVQICPQDPSQEQRLQEQRLLENDEKKPRLRRKKVKIVERKKMGRKMKKRRKQQLDEEEEEDDDELKKKRGRPPKYLDSGRKSGYQRLLDYVDELKETQESLEAQLTQPQRSIAGLLKHQKEEIKYWKTKYQELENTPLKLLTEQQPVLQLADISSSNVGPEQMDDLWHAWKMQQEHCCKQLTLLLKMKSREK